MPRIHQRLRQLEAHCAPMQCSDDPELEVFETIPQLAEYVRRYRRGEGARTAEGFATLLPEDLLTAMADASRILREQYPSGGITRTILRNVLLSTMPSPNSHQEDG